MTKGLLPLALLVSSAILTCLVSVITLWVVMRSRSIRSRSAAHPAWESLIPESNFLTVDQTKIHYVQSGEGTDLVLLHGIGASLFIWRFLFPILQTRFRVTAIDVPGFGRSDKERRRTYDLDSQVELVKKSLDQLDIRSATLAGSSMGGAIALWLAQTQPHRFARVIALAPATDHRLVPAALTVTASIVKGLAPFFSYALNRVSMRIILSYVMRRPELITDACIDAYLEPFRERESIGTFWSALSLLRDPRLPEGLKNLNAEVLILYGDQDRMVPRSSIDYLRSCLKKSKLIIHADAGHHLMEDEPLWTAEQFFAFVP